MSSQFEGAYSGEEAVTGDTGTKAGTDIPEMLVFDIDGVITEPLTGAVELAVVRIIVEILEGGEPIAFNTGRGLNWVLRDILPYFEERVSNRNLLSNLCIV